MESIFFASHTIFRQPFAFYMQKVKTASPQFLSSPRSMYFVFFELGKPDGEAI